MLFGPEAAQRNINQAFEEFFLELQTISDLQAKEEAQQLFLIRLCQILNVSEDDVIQHLELDKNIIENLYKHKCSFLISELKNKGFKISLYSYAQSNRFDNKSKLGLINIISNMTDDEMVSSGVRSSSVRDIVKKSMCLVGDYFGDVANRKLKALNGRIESIIYNVTILAGQEAGFELASLISGIIADTSVDLVSKYGTSYLLDYITGASIGYLVQSSLNMDSMKGSAETALQVSDILSKFLTKGASDVFANGFASSFTRYVAQESMFPGLKQMLFKYMAAKPGLAIAKKASSNVNTTFEILETPYKFYNQTKDAIHGNITNPIVQTIYRGPLRDFVKGYYGGLCAEISKKATRDVADKHIKGKIKASLDGYVDHLFPGKPLTYQQYISLEDLTDNYSLKVARQLQRKELAEKAVTVAATTYANEAYPEMMDNVYNMSDNLNALLVKTLNIPPYIVDKIMDGEELSDEDLEEINNHKYGHFTNSTINFTKKVFDVFTNALIFAGFKIDHEAVANECAELLLQSIEDLERAPKLLDRISQIMDSYSESDKQIIDEQFRNIVNKNHYFTQAIRNFIEKRHATATMHKPALNENMLHVFNWFLANQFEPNHLDQSGVSPIHLAIAKVENEDVCVQMLKAMLKFDSDLSVTTFMGNENILHLAAFHGKLEIVKFLMSKLDKATKRDLLNGNTRRLQTPLHCAIAKGHKAVAVELIKNGASLTALDENDRTPFMAAKLNIDEFVDNNLNESLQQRLMTNMSDDVDINTMTDLERERRVLLTLVDSPQRFMDIELHRYKQGYQPYLLSLIQEGQIDWAHHLVFGLKMPLPCIIPNKSKMFCFLQLKLISRYNSVEAAELLNYLLDEIKLHYKESFADIVNFSSNEDTPLILDAAENGNTQAIELLLNYGANINTLNAKGESLLLVALKNKKYATAKYLLEKGANPLITNYMGESAASYWGTLYHRVPTWDYSYKALYPVMTAKLDLGYMAENYLVKDTNALMTYCKMLLTHSDLNFIKNQLVFVFKKSPHFVNEMDCHGQTLLNYSYSANLPELALWLLKECKADPFVENAKKQSFHTAWNSYANVGINPMKSGVRKEVTAQLASLAKPR